MKTVRLVLVVLFCLCSSTSAIAADEMLRAWLISVKGNYINLREAGGSTREIRLSRDVVVVSRDNSTDDVNRIMKNSRLLVSVNNGVVTTVVIEEVPK